jgi:hypothetical protein
MSARGSESRDFRWALALTALIVGAFVAYARWGSTMSTSPAHESIDEINARMRAGYKEPEGKRLRRRLHELSNQRWEANCRHR